MSKEAAMRAMREARYRERAAKSAPGATRASSTPTGQTPAEAAPASPSVRATEPAAAGPHTPVESSDALCGHRSMNGRTCTRELGHAAKSHRYA